MRLRKRSTRFLARYSAKPKLHTCDTLPHLRHADNYEGEPHFCQKQVLRNCGGHISGLQLQGPLSRSDGDNFLQFQNLISCSGVVAETRPLRLGRSAKKQRLVHFSKLADNETVGGAGTWARARPVARRALVRCPHVTKAQFVKQRAVLGRRCALQGEIPSVSCGGLSVARASSLSIGRGGRELDAQWRPPARRTR
jgi:hypothetical protein